MAEATMRPVANLPADVARKLVGVFTDIDDTITTDGRLPAAAYGALERLHEAGAVAKVSSIHVNGWFGQYDKLSMTRVFVRDALGLDLEAAKEKFMFCGDSPNDEPMFRFFPYGCGVANVRDFASRMTALPALVSEARGGEGFVEIANRILSARAGNAGKG